MYVYVCIYNVYPDPMCLLLEKLLLFAAHKKVTLFYPCPDTQYYHNSIVNVAAYARWY